LIATAKMAAHVGADANIDLWRGTEMKVGIETRDGVNLAYRNVNFSSKDLELVRRKVTKIPLNFPKFFEHDARGSALSKLRSNQAGETANV
jgi:hypothetical protein